MYRFPPSRKWSLAALRCVTLGDGSDAAEEVIDGLGADDEAAINLDFVLSISV